MILQLIDGLPDQFEWSRFES
ncbi:hypothetical protein XAP412_950058 [Xanthomonas phaseoli pv. phaseoli]|uniref:Transposase n=1 Tax=Xanthomonas campestris pv. phaseoli TaxID=317013 RepID=A0AB38E6F0_XANCH|nr:hypothetical protein XAP6984_980058 [Xanthomonas phaseoli pv. phaseoli]SON91646.1 hypothetical protein XAP412_950058 [Xanthomonas phaseoli pv. phaseoli]SON93046.1 hypothetical protein XAP7430_970058 [Xanthomonas phaseoli pv. phaseoli]SOO30033.1 hypothetical protein XAP6164_3930011 [Xanthomonas phaseoli pv. phaseoli]